MRPASSRHFDISAAAPIGGTAFSGKNPLDPEALVAAVKHESHLIIGIVLLVCLLYFIGMRLTAPKNVDAA